MLAADLYVAFAPEFQAKRTAPESDAPAATAPVEMPEAVALAPADDEPVLPAPRVTKGGEGSRVIAPSLKIAGLTSDDFAREPESPIAIAAGLSAEDSGIQTDGDGAGVPRIQGFDTLVALGMFGDGGGIGGGGIGDGGGPHPPGPNPPHPGDGAAPGGDGQTPGGGGQTPGGGGVTPGDPDGEIEPPVLETPIPGALFLFASALAGLFFTRRIKNADGSIEI